MILGLTIFLVTLVLIVRIPLVQNFIASKATSYVYQKTGFETEINHIYITWFDEIDLDGIEIRDLSDSIMVSIDELNADLDIGKLLINRNIVFNDISMKNGQIQLAKHLGETDINLAAFLQRLGSREKNSSEKPSVGINIGNVSLEKIDLSYNNFNAPIKSRGIDFSHLSLSEVSSNVSNVVVGTNRAALNLNHLQTDINDQLKLKNLSSSVIISEKGILLNELNLQTGLSEIKGDINFIFESLSALSDIVHEVVLDAKIKQGTIDTKELGLFVNIPRQLVGENISLSGGFSGSLSSLQGKDVSLSIKNLISFNADMFVLGLPKISETFLDIDFKKSRVTLSQLFKKFGNDSIQFPKSINQLSYQGEFTGFLSDFVTKGNFKSKAGELYTDVNLKVNNYPLTSTYEGFLSTHNFDLGSVVGDTSLLQKIALTGSLNGTGLTVESADLYLKSNIEKVGINGYEFSNINTDGEFKSQFFDGKLLVNDPSLQLKVDGKIDMSNDKEEIEAYVEIDSVNLKNINLSNEQITISTRSNISIEGFGVDRINGSAVLKDFSLKRYDKTLFLDSIVLDIRRVNEDKIIDLVSNGMEAQLSGDFQLSQVGNDIVSLGEELLLELENDSLQLVNYYLNREETKKAPYALQYFINVTDPNVFIAPFTDAVYVSEQLELYGGLYHGESTDLSLNLLADSIQFLGRSMTDSYLTMNIAKANEASKVTGQVEMFSDKQYWGTNIETRKLETALAWDGDEIMFDFVTNKKDSITSIDISGNVSFLSDVTVLSFDSSQVIIDQHLFHFNKENQVSFLSDSTVRGIDIENLVLTDGSQFLSLQGTWDSYADIDLVIGNLDVSNFSVLSGRELEGIANGYINFKQDLSGGFFSGNLKVQKMYVDEFLVGDLNATTTWNELERKILLDFNIDREGTNSIEVRGDLLLDGSDNGLDLKARFDGARLALLEPYFKGVASGISGQLTGELDVTGTLAYPIINGLANVEQGNILIDYLKTKYSFNGELGFSQDKISLQKLRVIDFKGNKAFLTGDIEHNGFKDILFDVKGELFDFNVLNTNAADNKLFYGEAYATGNVDIFGTPKNVKISANAVTNKNTKIYIPLSEDTGSDIKEYISFVDFSDTLAITKPLIEETDLRGVELDLEIDVTPEAYFEMIFDINSGDIIRGKGDGDIKLTVNTEGDFSMFGDYEIKEGGYNFTLYNIINKEFMINPGSRISWYGDPYKAILDIEANYSQVVSMAPLGDDNTNARATSIVKLFLKGEMLEPEINFDIDFEDYPLDQSVFVEAFKASVKSDQQALNRQVFSLLILKKILNEQEGFGVAGQAIGVSVSEFVSNQLSYWITQVDDNLEIDVDISSLDADAFNAFRLRLSYKFLDGRLRVTRGGGFGTVNPQGQVDPNKLGNIIGDITLEYLLTPDGRLRVKMFTRNNQNVLEDDYAFETGASIRYVRSFDYLKEIWLKTQVKKVRFVGADGKEVEKTEVDN